MKLGLSDIARLEANFYLLCHNSVAHAEIFRASKSLLDRGIRLRWNVRPNIEVVRQSDPQKAALLGLVSEVMAGERDQVFLDQVLARWP